MRRVVIDITDWNRFLYSNNAISGVHRIAFGILRSWGNAGLPFEIIRHDPRTNRHKIVSKAFFEEDFSEPIFLGGNPIKYTYNKYVQRTTKYYTELAKANIRRRLMERTNESPNDFLLADYTPEPNDTLFFCGAGWDAPETMLAAKKWKLLYPGFRFVILVHDFIPLLKRVYQNKLGTRQFRRWFREASTVADQFISISENTKKDFIRLWPQLGRGPIPPCDVVTNPHEFLSIDNAQKAKSLSLDMPERRRRYILTVGSLSSHKNLERLLASWKAINFFAIQRPILSSWEITIKRKWRNLLPIVDGMSFFFKNHRMRYLVCSIRMPTARYFQVSTKDGDCLWARVYGSAEYVFPHLHLL